MTSQAQTARFGPKKGLPKRIFSPEQVALRQARVRNLTAEGVRDREIARQLGVSKTTVRNDRLALGLPGHSPGQPPLTPLPEERPCQTCGKPFRPRRNNVKEGGGRFHSKECMAHDEVRREASREAVTRLNGERAELVANLKKQQVLLTSEEVAAELGVTVAMVHGHVRDGRLVPERIPTVGTVRLLFDPQAVLALRRTWRDGSRARSR